MRFALPSDLKRWWHHRPGLRYLVVLLLAAVACVVFGFLLDSTKGLSSLKTQIVGNLVSGLLAVPATAVITIIFLDRVSAAREEERWRYRCLSKIDELSRKVDYLGQRLIRVYYSGQFDWDPLPTVGSSKDWDARRKAWKKRVENIERVKKLLTDAKAKAKLAELEKSPGASAKAFRTLMKSLQDFAHEIRLVRSEGPWWPYWRKWINNFDKDVAAWSDSVRKRLGDENRSVGRCDNRQDGADELSAAQRILEDFNNIKKTLPRPHFERE